MIPCRLTSVLLILLAVIPDVCGQVRDILSLPDRIMSSSRIGRTSTIEAPDVPVPDTSRISFPEKGSLGISKDFEFFKYLEEEGLDTDALTLVRGSFAPSDTLDFLRGKVLFSSRRWSQASELFSRIPLQSPFGQEAFFYRLNSLAYLGEYDFVDRPAGLSNHLELYALEGAGLALLRSDKEDWNRFSGNFTFSDHDLEESERIMSEIAASRFSGSRKRAGIAALASALVPGSGKVYAGRVGEGVASFLTVGSLGAITAENWNRHGLKDWRTILAGSLCATFYLGNIYGSYLSVSVEKDERAKAENAVILYHLHIPVRNSFR